MGNEILNNISTSKMIRLLISSLFYIRQAILKLQAYTLYAMNYFIILGLIIVFQSQVLF